MDTEKVIFKINPTAKFAELFLVLALLTLFLTLINKYLGLLSLPFFIVAGSAAISRKFVVFSMNDEYVCSKTGFLSKKIISIPLSRVQNAGLRMGFFQRLINIGEIAVESAGEEDRGGKAEENEVVMCNIDKPEYYYKLIMEKVGRK
jgi:uncharacterized membrane protein YdbT with pleckstrin-like domain